MKKQFGLLLLLVSLVLPLKAEKWALLVGINDYQNDIGALKYCVADVEAFRDALIETAGYKPANVHLMTDQMSGQDLPTRINVIMRLDLLASQIQPEDTLIFYFSGDGISTEGQSFLLASDSNVTTFTTLELSAIPLQ
ncbi:MAG: caspase family protein, partial [Candidatus Poribacteria bacterium]|nr:caspase family protein [Candidatus Poribacteria bacterium]